MGSEPSSAWQGWEAEQPHGCCWGWDLLGVPAPGLGERSRDKELSLTRSAGRNLLPAKGTQVFLAGSRVFCVDFMSSPLKKHRGLGGQCKEMMELNSSRRADP